MADRPGAVRRLMCTVLLLAAAAAGPGVRSSAQQAPEDALARGFDTPPDAAKPRVWWHWMNGNITKEGIKLDLEWMQRVGIGGFQNFDASLFPRPGRRQAPRLHDARVEGGVPVRDAARGSTRARRGHRGLAGVERVGRAWVKPEQAMKKLVWSETRVEGGQPFTAHAAEATHDDRAFPERAASST